MLCACAYACIMKTRERERQVISCFQVKETCKGKKKMRKKKAYRQYWAVYAWKTMIFLIICPYSLFFSHSPILAPCICVCVRVSNDAMQNAIDERATRIWRGRERITAPFVVHHVERISFLFIFSRFLFSLLILMRFSLFQTYHQAAVPALR